MVLTKEVVVVLYKYSPTYMLIGKEEEEAHLDLAECCLNLALSLALTITEPAEPLKIKMRKKDLKILNTDLDVVPEVQLMRSRNNARPNQGGSH